jgi:glycosyltransferase involved in cell wall biosynthesis
VSKPVSIALCMIVKNAEKTLKECLISAERAAFDEYVIVDTGSGDKTPNIVREFSTDLPLLEDRSRPAVSYLRALWSDDFSQARNYSFNAAGAQWRMFLDADDVLVNGAFLKGKLEDLLQRHPSLNAVSMVYDYAEGETSHEKIRLVKWLDDDGKPLGWQWTDPVHEFLELPGKQKVVATLLNGHEHDIYVKHAKKTYAELVASAERNKRILDAARNDGRRCSAKSVRSTTRASRPMRTSSRPASTSR